MTRVFGEMCVVLTMCTRVFAVHSGRRIPWLASA